MASTSPIARAHLARGSENAGMVEVQALASDTFFVRIARPRWAVGDRVELMFPAPGRTDLRFAGTIKHVVTPALAQASGGQAGYVMAVQMSAAAAGPSAAAGAARADADAARTQPAPPPQKTKGDVERSAPVSVDGAILLVEDDRILAKLIETWLKRHHRPVVHVTTGAATMQTLQRGAPALLIVDSLLPDTCGDKLIRKLRAVCRAPVIATSGILKGRDAQMAVGQAGADRFLAKPLTEATLIGAIVDLIGAAPAPANDEVPPSAAAKRSA